MSFGRYISMLEPLTFDMFLQIREEIPELVMNSDVLTAAQIFAQVETPCPFPIPAQSSDRIRAATVPVCADERQLHRHIVFEEKLSSPQKCMHRCVANGSPGPVGEET